MARYIGYGIEALTEGITSGLELATRLSELRWRKEERERQKKLWDEAVTTIQELGTQLDSTFSTPVEAPTTRTSEISSLGDLTLRYREEKGPEIPQWQPGSLLLNPTFIKAVGIFSLINEDLAMTFLKAGQAIEEGRREEATAYRELIRHKLDFLKNISPEVLTTIDPAAFEKIVEPELLPYVEILKNVNREGLQRLLTLGQASRSAYGFEATSKLYPEYGLPSAKEVVPDWRIQLHDILRKAYEEGEISKDKYASALFALAGMKDRPLEQQIAEVEKAIGRPLTEEEKLRLAGVYSPLKQQQPPEATAVGTEAFSPAERWVINDVLDKAPLVFDPNPTDKNKQLFKKLTTNLSHEAQGYVASQLAAMGYLDQEWVDQEYFRGIEQESEPGPDKVPAEAETPEKEGKPFLTRVKEFFGLKEKTPDLSKMSNAELLALAVQNKPGTPLGDAIQNELKKRGIIP